MDKVLQRELIITEDNGKVHIHMVLKKILVLLVRENLYTNFPFRICSFEFYQFYRLGTLAGGIYKLFKKCKIIYKYTNIYSIYVL